MKLRAPGENPRKSVLLIVSFGNLDLEQFRDSLEAAGTIYRLEPRILTTPLFVQPKISLIERQRKQLEAKKIIGSFRDALRNVEEKWRVALVVTNYDIYAGETNFVFGLANPQEAIAILSTARLIQWEEGITPSKIKERILKEAAHEVGHLANLTHCENAACLMFFSNDLNGVDSKLPVLCDCCKRSLRMNGR